jgi:DNA invertase Pin-like site-specific DNA recombinase
VPFVGRLVAGVKERAVLVGYARVSTAEQKLDLQEDALRAAGCERLHTDVASGASTARAGLDNALRYLRSGDTLVVWKLDRLGRSLPHLIETIKLLDQRGVGFKSLHEHLDTTTPGGKLIFHLFGALAEFEPGARVRALIRERTQAGLVAARARGRTGGRPAVLDARRLQRAVALYREGKLTPAEIARTVGCSRSTLYRTIRAATLAR